MSKAFPIKDFPNYYITDTGDVYSRSYRNTGRIKKLKPSLTKHGYLQVCLYYGDKSKRFRIHQLVAETFLLNPENKPCINHINGQKDDNRVENLEFCTYSENTTHFYHTLGYKRPSGKNNSRSKIILQIKNGKVIAEFYGAADASKQTGINRANIVACCNGRKWHHTAGGYMWKHKEVKNG